MFVIFSDLVKFSKLYTALQISNKNMYKKVTQNPLGKYFPTLVNIFTKFTEYTHYQVKDIYMTLVILQ